MLNIPNRFKSAQSSNVGFAYPLVIIKVAEDSSEWIYLSQSKGTFAGNMYEDFNLKVGSVSESVDISSRKFSISNVKISLSNYYIKKERFTDKFAGITFSGLEVSIYYANKNCESLNDCVEVFKGYIRNYSANDQQVSFNVEDYSQYIMQDKTFPKRKTINLDKETVEFSKNVPYPLVYGLNEKSKFLFTRPDRASVESRIYADATYDDSIDILGFTNIDKPLKVFRDDMYMDVYQTFQSVPSDLIVSGYRYSHYNGKPQYEYNQGNDTIIITKHLGDLGITNMMPLRIQARDQFQLVAERKLSGIEVAQEGWEEGEGESSSLSYGETDILIQYQGNGNGYYVNDITPTLFEFPKPGVSEFTSLGYYKSFVLSRLDNHAIENRHYQGSLSWLNPWPSSWDAYDFWFDVGTMYYLNECLYNSRNQGNAGQVDFLGAFETVYYPGLTNSNGGLFDEVKEHFILPDGNENWVMHTDIRYVEVSVSHYDEDGYAVYSYPSWNYGGMLLEHTQNADLHPALAALNSGTQDASYSDGIHSQVDSVEHALEYGYFAGIKFKRTGWDDIVLGLDEEIPINYIKPAYFDWLAPGEVGTLRKYFYGRRVTPT